MKRSRLEVCVNLLEILAQSSPSNLSQLTQKAGLNYKVAKGLVNFLVQEGLIEEKIGGETNATFIIKQSGLNVVKYFTQSKKAFPVIEESQKGSSYYY